MDQTKAWLGQLWSPAVMVLASREADELCTSSTGLAVNELLRPFGVLRQLNNGLGVPVRTVAEQSRRLQNWLLRFYAGADMFQPPPEAADAFLAGVLTQAAAGAADDVPEMEALIESADSADATPWFTEYRRQYLRMLGFGAHETMDHPVACLLVLPSTFEGDFGPACAALFDQGMPPLMKQGTMDARVLRQCVLLHDAQTRLIDLAGAKARAEQASAALGIPCHVITINGSSGAPSPSPQRWDAALAGGVVGGGAGEPASRAPLPSGGRGAGLSSQDISALEAFVQELAVRGVVPHIEARIRALDQTATAARRGLRNQLKSLLFRKAASPAGEGGGQQAGGGADGAAAGGPASYPASSIEAQLRQLSDLCMMVGDHETALSTLRLLAADFKADRAFRHYAGVQEAMAVAAALAGGAASDAASSFREAYYRYASLAQASPPDAAGARLATRAALLMAGFLGAAGRHADASWIAMKAHFGEDNLRGGLLLERAAHSLLRLRPPQPRKFSFHLVLAGLRYNQGGQRALARRAYAQALSVYAGRGWDTIEEHVHEALGKLCEGGGDAAGALAHFTRALALCPGGSEGMQRLHLQQFGQALKGTTAELGYAPQVDLPLPVVDVEHVGLAVAGQAGYASVEARQVPREEWAPLQAALQPSADAAPTWLDGGSRAGLADQPERHNCCVGEDIGVDVGLTNPLRLALAVTRLRLVCQFEPAAGGGAPAAAPAGGAAPPRPEAPPFQIREERITLHGGERAVVHLRVRPLRPGTLRVEGVAWELDGEAHGQRSFAIPRPRPRKPGSSVALLDAERPPAGGLVFAVLPPMPRLEVALEGLPATVLEGQLVRATLRLKNTGAMTLQGLSMAAGGGDMFLESSSPASGGDVDGNGGVETPGGGAPAKKAPSAATVSAATRQGVPVFCLDPATKLGVNQELCLPLWLRSTRPGPTRFSCVWYYEPVVKLDALRFRTLRASFTASTLPSLQLAAAVAPAASSPGRYLLQLQALNLQGLETFALQQLSVPTAAWAASHLAGVQPAGEQRGSLALDVELAPESSAGLHFHLAARDGAAGAGDGGLSPAEAYLYAAGASAAPREPQPGGKAPAGQGAPPPPPVDAVVKWRATSVAGGQAVSGFHVVHRARFQSGPPVHVQLCGPSEMAHDFGHRPLCTVELVLRLRNMLPMPAAVQVDTGKYQDGGVVAPGVATWGGLPSRAAGVPLGEEEEEEEVPSPSTPAPPPHGAGVSPARQYVWCGAARTTLLAVPPGRTVELPLRVAVTAPGWLALADYVVAWRYEGAPQLAGSATGPPCFVHVSNQ